MKLVNLALLAVPLFPLCGLAASVYVYHGNPYQMCLGPACVSGASITASIEVAAPLAANTAYVGPGGSPSDAILTLLHWSISDGTSFLSDLTPDVDFVNGEYQFITDDSGKIIYWMLGAGAPASSPVLMMATGNMSGETLDTVFDSASLLTYHYASNQDSPGTWSAIPEPGTLGLTLCGILAVLCGCRRTCARSHKASCGSQLPHAS